MSIKPLSQQTSSKLVSGQLIIDPLAVVRELCDNAIDASASNLQITLAKDFSSIEVKDNGTGISSQNRPLVGSVLKLFLT